MLPFRFTKKAKRIFPNSHKKIDCIFGLLAPVCPLSYGYEEHQHQGSHYGERSGILVLNDSPVDCQTQNVTEP